MQSLSRRAFTYGLITMLGLFCAVPSLIPEASREYLPSWYASNHLNLGLDLRGGSYLLMEVNVDSLMRDLNKQFSDALADDLRESNIAFGSVRVSHQSIALRARDPDTLGEMADVVRNLNLTPENIRAYEVTLDGDAMRLDVTRSYQDAMLDDAVEQSLEVVRRRLDESGLVEPSITRQGTNGIEIQLPGVSDPQRIQDLLGTTAKMSFHWVANSNSTDVITLRGELPEESYTLESAIAMEGRHVNNASLGFHPDTGEALVVFRLDNQGGSIFGEMTRTNVGRALAVVLDDRVITAPVIRTPILGGSGEISGGFTSSEAADLAVMLRAGALPAELDVIEQRTVGPNIGSDAIRMGMLSGVTGGLLVLAFMVFIYGSWGFIAWASLTINVGLIIAVLGLLQGTLTLPGIAGIILGIGMAVDANILINERIREEVWRGKSNILALDTGFKKAWSTILDSNVTTLIAVSLLFTIGSGPVQGFAATIGIGLLTSMFTAIAITRLLMELVVRRQGKRPVRIGVLPFLERFRERYSTGARVIDFMRAGTTGLIVSAVLSAASLGLMLAPGLDYGIDFSGGALVEVHSPQTSIETLRTALENSDVPEIAIQEFGVDGDFQLRLPLQQTTASGDTVVEDIRQVVLAVAPDADFPRADLVGPRVSGDFADLSILAVLSAGLGMLCYLWFRFENHFAIAAIATIALDLTKTIGFMVIAGVEFNLTSVAALLALIGYSINDKVVVFDRIRENLVLMPDLSLEEIMNRSITATLTRTVMTSGSTFLAMLPMAIFGGAAVASFALPMLFGIVVGTSSSIFIASPILLRLGKRRERLGLHQVQVNNGLTDAELMRP